MPLITVIKWETFRKYHIKQSVFRDDVSKTKNILSFHTVWVDNRLLLSAKLGLSAQTKTAPVGAAID